jgi:hypothetical protein
VNPDLFEVILVVELYVVDLRGILSKHEDDLFSGVQVLGVAPLGVHVVGAVVLALDVHEKDGVRLYREGGDEAVVDSGVLAPV